jgi:tetratricopeptide (TPR) repeat protein/transcriptional regulator with XRE-family HTH domain
MSTSQKPSFGALLRQHRLAAGFAQGELAERAHLSVEAINTLERGTRRAPRPSTVRLLADALALSANERAALFSATRLPTGTIHPKTRPGPFLQQNTPTWPLVGRTRELTVLERHLAGEGPPLLLLAGEPGIGKSRLLAEVSQQASVQGWCVLEGGCHRRSGQEPYAPLLGALEHHLAQVPTTNLRTALHQASWLVHLLPELAERNVVPAPAWTLPPEQERRLVFAAVRRFLANVAGPSGTLVVLDDLHWASPDALDLLTSLLGAPEDPPLRVVGTYRSTEVRPPDPLGVLVADLATHRLVTHHLVGPLTPAEAHALLEALLPEERSDGWGARLVERTGGVPFFLVSCALDAQASRVEGRQDQEVPWSVAESIRLRVALLPQMERDLLETAATVGRQAERAVLLGMAPLASRAQETRAALERLCQARLLTEAGEDGYQCVHDLIREVVLADLSAVRRVQLHQVVAETLEQLPGKRPVERLAYHYSRAGVTEKATFYLEQAGDRAWKLHAHIEAERAYRELVTLQERLGRTMDWARVSEKLILVLEIQARYDEALEVLEGTAEVYRQAEAREQLWRIMAVFGRIASRQGDPRRPLERLLPLVAEAKEAIPSPGVAALSAGLAVVYSRVDSQLLEGLAPAARAVELTRAVGEEAHLLQALHAQGRLLMRVGQLEAALPVVEEWRHVAERLGDLVELAASLNSLYSLYTEAGALDQGRQALDQAVEIAEHVADPGMAMTFHSNRGGDAFLRGDWGQAHQDYERAVTLLRQMRRHRFAGAPLVGLGRLNLAQGQWEAAEAALREGLRLAEEQHDLVSLWEGLRCLAEWELLEGRPQDALARLDPYVEVLGETCFPTLLAWAELDLGHEHKAETLVARGLKWATNHREWVSWRETLRIKARLLQRQQRWQEASATLEEALDHVPNLPYETAKTLCCSGHLLRALGEPDQARERLEAALEILHELGERLYAEQVEQGLAGLEC